MSAWRTPEKVTIYEDTEDQWRWQVKSKGGKILADSGQGYSRKADCILGLEKVTYGDYERHYQARTKEGTMYQQGLLYRQFRGESVETFVEVMPRPAGRYRVGEAND